MTTFGHVVAGKIINCDPLIIRCMEHPLQGINVYYDLTISAPRSAGGIVYCEASSAAPPSPQLTQMLNHYNNVAGTGGHREVENITCFC